MLDTRKAIETPEGVEFELGVAGVAPRAVAWIVDALIRIGIYFVLANALAVFGRVGAGLILILLFLFEWFYPVLFEVLRNGATPGKKLMRIRVVHDDGTPVGWSASLIRNLLRAVDFLPFFYLFGFLSMLLDRQFRRLGDLAAGTLVVYVERPPKPVEIANVQPLAPPVPLSLEEQRALIHFAERAPNINPARLEELAGLLRPLTGTDGADGVRVLYQYAAWLKGRR